LTPNQIQTPARKQKQLQSQLSTLALLILEPVATMQQQAEAADMMKTMAPARYKISRNLTWES
jgi:hypothetical protein